MPNIAGSVYGNTFNGAPIFLGNDGWALYGFKENTSGNVASYQSGSSYAVRSVVRVNASRSSSVYGRSSTVQPQTVKMYAYIVLAESTKTAIQADIDQIATDFNIVNTAATNANEKVTNWSNSLGKVECIVNTYQSRASWYRIWSDGWCEQGGKFVITTAPVAAGSYNTGTLTLLKPLSKFITYNCQARHDRFNSGLNTEPSGQALTSVSIYQVNDSAGSFANPFVVWTIGGYVA